MLRTRLETNEEEVPNLVGLVFPLKNPEENIWRWRTHIIHNPADTREWAFSRIAYQSTRSGQIIDLFDIDDNQGPQSMELVFLRKLVLDYGSALLKRISLDFQSKMDQFCSRIMSSTRLLTMLPVNASVRWCVFTTNSWKCKNSPADNASVQLY